MLLKFMTVHLEEIVKIWLFELLLLIELLSDESPLSVKK